MKSSNQQPAASNQQRATSNDRVFIALGSNLGDRAAWLRQAQEKLFGAPTVQLVAASTVYETEPVGKIDQPAFLNQVLEVRTTLAPENLLSRLLQVERELGRARNERWGPRNIDLDLLAFGGCILKTGRLTLPHPELHRRRFVLQPWAEIAPEFIVPGFSATVEGLLKNCGDNNRVQKIERQNYSSENKRCWWYIDPPKE
ncbi:2-amino-4-hydroxy-6-hydroxymethyldihydropteridine diphosphokinase [candidate division KSB1 bacterium]|nr:2-amino-4-hydroxy-6-hydroxymethyldihydropteridine diphosphokinase [candidate division KSB1 bacterium]